MKKVTFAIAGLGSRGLDAYAEYQKKHPDEMEIVAVADLKEERRNLAKKEYGIKADRIYESAEEMLKEKRLADAIIIATQDQDHVREALMAIEKGYHILMEKPISPSKDECLLLLDKARGYDKKIAVCHVLRYTSFYRTIKEIIDSKRLGAIVSIDAIEAVGYWHMAHSFVRGNWRNYNTTSPMLMQKSCHDMDILRYLTGEKAKRISSSGSLMYFKRENAPEGASERCTVCKVKDSCPFDAEKIYITDRKTGIRHNRLWPCNVLQSNPGEEKIRKAIEVGPYGRCVFRADNNVVDHQSVLIEFESGATATFQMIGLSKENHRSIHIFFTNGELIADMLSDEIVIKNFDDKEYEKIRIEKASSGHLGGDEQIMKEFIMAVNGEGDISSSLSLSIDSHMMVFAAEESRITGKEVSLIDDFKGQAYNPEDGITFEWMGRAEGIREEQ